MVLLAKYGISQNFNVIYVSNADVFPVLFCATSLGICNFLSRSFSAMSPLISTMEEPLPMIIFTSFSAVAGVLVWFVQVPKKEEEDQKASTTSSKIRKSKFNPEENIK